MSGDGPAKVKKRLAASVQGPSKHAATGADRAQQEALKADVRSFAAQLGLAAPGGDAAGFDDRDFRPEAASKKLNTNKKEKRASQDKPVLTAKPSKGLLPDQKVVRAKRPDHGSGKQARDKNNRQQTKTQLPAAQHQPAASLPAAEPSKPAPTELRPGSQPGQGRVLQPDEPALWYEAAGQLSLPSDATAASASASAAERSRMQADAEAVLEAEAARFAREQGRKSGGDQRWLQQVRVSGTVSDKLAAMTLQLQESAVANMKTLDELIKWATKRSGARGVAGQAVDALAEVFVAALLPDRRLKSWSEQPLPSGPVTGKEVRRQLLYMHVEDCIKTRYATFVGVLEAASRDNLEFIKDKAIRALAKLLAAKPEQEARLLAALVNKLGDPSRKLASKVGFLLGEMLHEHPRMALIVVREVERFIFRPGLAPRARYYAVVFLNQLQLSHNPAFGGSELAEKLIDIYFAIFALLMSSKPPAEEESEGRKQHQPPVKQSKKQKARAAAAKKPVRGRQKGNANDDNDAEPQTKEVDARMLGALLVGVRRAFPYVESSNADALVEKHSQALFRISHSAPLGVGLQSLALLFQLMSAQSAASDRFYRALYAIMLSPEVASASRAPMLFSLTFKALQADPRSPRVAAFAKRLLQLALAYSPAFGCGSLLLLSQILQERPGLWNAVLEPEEADDDVERFQDVPDPGSDADEQSQPGKPSEQQPQTAGDAESDEDAETEPSTAKGKGAGDNRADKGTADSYDMRKREPAFCGADRAAWWELGLLTQHWHPSVAAFARSLLQGKPIHYTGDPLKDLSLTAFLDKFVQRKAKAGKAKGRSLMQPLPAQAAQPSSAAIGSAAFAALAERDVPADALIFHRFYSIAAERAAKGQSKRAKRRRGSGDEADDSPVSESDEEADELLAAEEDMGDEGGGADPNANFDYSKLAAAIQADQDSPDAVLPYDAAPDDDVSDDDDDAVSDDEDELPEGSSDADSDVDEHLLMGDSDDDSAAEADAASDDEGSSVDTGDVNPFDLQSGSDDDMVDAAPADGYDTGTLPGALNPADSDTDSGEWLMHNPAAGKVNSSQTKSSKKHTAASKLGKGKQNNKDSSKKPFIADAEDYAQLLDKDEQDTAAAAAGQAQQGMHGGSERVDKRAGKPGQADRQAGQRHKRRKS